MVQYSVDKDINSSSKKAADTIIEKENDKLTSQAADAEPIRYFTTNDNQKEENFIGDQSEMIDYIKKETAQ